MDFYQICVTDGEAVDKLLITKWVPLKLIQLDYWSPRLGLTCSVTEGKKK